DYIAKIRAAAAARKSKDFTIIARTDSRAVIGFEEAISRANEALANGADVAFVEAPQTLEEVAAVPKRVKGPCLLNVVRGGKTPDLEFGEAEKMGYAIAILPGLLFGAIVNVCDKLLAETKALNRYPGARGPGSPAKLFARFGAAEWDERRTAFRDPPKAQAAE